MISNKQVVEFVYIIAYLSSLLKQSQLLKAKCNFNKLTEVNFFANYNRIKLKIKKPPTKNELSKE